MSTRTLRISEPRDLLALVPYRLGFAPWASVVLVCLRGPRRRVGLVARADLPPVRSVDALAEILAGYAAADGAGHVVVVVYADRPQAVGQPPTDDRSSGEPASPPAAPRQLADAVGAALSSEGVTMLDAFHVNGDRYVSLLCEDPECCPPEGTPCSDLQGSVVSAEMVALGCVVASDRAVLVGDLRPADDDRRERVEAAARAHEKLDPGPRRERGRGRRARWRGQALACWRQAVAVDGAAPPVDGTAPTVDGEVAEQAAGVLLAGLTDVIVRDAVMMACVPGSGRAPEQLLTSGAGTAVESVLDRVFGPDDPIRPDELIVEAAGVVLRSLVRQGSPHRTAPALGLLAWLSWWSGDGASAHDFVDRALAADDGHRLALLLAEALAHGVPPGWAQRDRQEDMAGAPRAD